MPRRREAHGSGAGSEPRRGCRRRRRPDDGRDGRRRPPSLGRTSTPGHSTTPAARAAPPRVSRSASATPTASRSPRSRPSAFARRRVRQRRARRCRRTPDRDRRVPGPRRRRRAACGAQFANDDSIALVLTGTLVVGNKEFYDAINGNKPLIIGNGLTVDDFVTQAGQSFTAGAVGVVAGMVEFILEEFQPETVAIVANDNAGGQAGANVLVKPTLDAKQGCSHRRLRPRHGDRPRRGVGDAGSRRRHGRRVPVARVAVQLHQHVRQHAIARHRPGRRDHGPVLRDADGAAPRGSRRGGRLPERLVLRRLRLQLLQPGLRVRDADLRHQGPGVRRARSPAPRRSSTPASPGRRSPTS